MQRGKANTKRQTMTEQISPQTEAGGNPLPSVRRTGGPNNPSLAPYLTGHMKSPSVPPSVNEVAVPRAHPRVVRGEEENHGSDVSGQ